MNHPNGSTFERAAALLALVLILTAACSPLGPGETPAPSAETQAEAGIPAFEHIVVIMFENHDYQQVVDSGDMPYLSRLAEENVLLTNYRAITHPSLPNYIALIGGDTFGIDSNCIDCFINSRNLADLIEASGRTWKTYQEDMPLPCYLGNKGLYMQKHNPFVYFDSIRRDRARCRQSVVPLTELEQDLAANDLPDFAFIMPNMCNSAHDCDLATADQWLSQIVEQLRSSGALGQEYMIFAGFEEGPNKESEGETDGGQVAAVIVSPLAQPGLRDDTPLSHYSLLKTISLAWDMPELKHAADEDVNAITAPWGN